MFSPKSVQFTLGSPLIAVHALAELRELLTALQISSGHDNALLKSSLKEGVGQSNSKAIQWQLNLGLANEASNTVPGDKQLELARAPVEVLIEAARDGVEPEREGGGDESEAHS